MKSSLSILADNLRTLLPPPEAVAGSQQKDWRNAAVLVPVYLSQNQQLHTVLTRRSGDLPTHAGEISFPGGRQRVGEDDLRCTVLRETQEEVGLQPETVELVGALPAIPTAVSSHMVYPFVGVINRPKTWIYDDGEVDHLLEPSLVELFAGFKKEKLNRRGVTFETNVYRLGENVVWGLTARVIYDFFTRINYQFRELALQAIERSPNDELSESF